MAFSPFLCDPSIHQGVQTLGSVEQGEQERISTFSTRERIKLGSRSAPWNAFFFLKIALIFDSGIVERKTSRLHKAFCTRYSTNCLGNRPGHCRFDIS